MLSGEGWREKCFVFDEGEIERAIERANTIGDVRIGSIGEVGRRTFMTCGGGGGGIVFSESSFPIGYE